MCDKLRCKKFAEYLLFIIVESCVSRFFLLPLQREIIAEVLVKGCQEMVVSLFMDALGKLFYTS